MRILVLATLAFIFPLNIYAQDQSPAEIAPEKKVFEDATDEQLREAQAYYKFCSDNESYNRIKDCKCSAAEYLDVRVTMGDTMKESEILEIIKNRCLKDEKRYGQLPADTNHDDDEISKLTDKELEEVESVLQECKGSYYMRTFLDCECIAAKFLDERKRLGPISHVNNIMARLRNDKECKNSVDAAGKAYMTCMDDAMVPSITNAPRKDFCECVAEEWVKQFEAYQGDLTSRARNSWSSTAMIRCSAKFQ
ncbi:MAG: hypothetical protein OEY94_03145 [Alphaproteobacteria bacterium]|nr:hypothetical protein [Alphaproteobacteria bacterium]